MNLPNKLTIFRVILIPFFVFFLLADIGLGTLAPVLALIIFIVASLTDSLDGYIARHYNQVTDFGKFLDPLADKLLVIAAGWSGKVKTASTMVGLCVMMALPGVTVLNWVVIGVIVLTTVYSGVEYFVQNWKCLWS